MIQKYIFNLTKLIVLMMWPLTVLAAVATGTVDTFSDITTIHILVMFVISTLSGLTALTIRIDSELKTQNIEKLPRPRLFVSSHMLGCWLAGVLATAVSQSNNFGIWTQIIVMIVASFTGAKFVEKISEIYIGKLTGTPTPATPINKEENEGK